MMITTRTKLNIEQDFKVEAGPGAGKTQFLVNHIHQVLGESRRLSAAKKIACITFTNTAVETIRKRLGRGTAGQVEVATIHGFLYRHIVKPYGCFLPAGYGVCFTAIQGHDEPIANGSYINAWLDQGDFSALSHPNTVEQLKNLPPQKAALKKWLLSAKCTVEQGLTVWSLDDRQARVYDKKSDRFIGIGKRNLTVLKRQFLDYKKQYWQKGRLDHEDVLFLAGVLIEKYPFILTVLRAQYPYFFVDEFQDTSPIQALILEHIRKEESVVGVIGDKAQAIYGFQGADVELFHQFWVEPECRYTLTDNHRSDRKIVELLNTIRTDLTQRASQSDESSMICLYVGDRKQAFHRAEKLCPDGGLVSLSRDNFTSNMMKNNLESGMYDRKLPEKLEASDSNKNRRNYMVSFICAIELAKNRKFKEALKHIQWIYREEREPQKIALGRLLYYIRHYEKYSTGTLMRFYELASRCETTAPLSAFRKGKARDFYLAVSYMELALCVNILDDDSRHITIHKAKGAEYDSVFVVGNKELLRFLLTPDLDGKEEHRIYYVALSRAKKQLFLHLEELETEQEMVLRELYGFDIERLNTVVPES